MVIPIQPGTFPRPADWPSSVCLTDFIFLKSKVQGANAFGPDLNAFINNAKAAGRKLVVMTFSSMPVSRKQMLDCSIQMVTKSKYPLSLVYVGKKYDPVKKTLEDQASKLVEQGLFMEMERAPFDILFHEMDAFIIHGGLGTTVEALRMHKPIAVSGVLLMDQRFWGKVCHDQGVGPPPAHIDDFDRTCVEFVDKALAPDSEWTANAKKKEWGEESEDGVAANVDAFAKFLYNGIAPVNTRRK